MDRRLFLVAVPMLAVACVKDNTLVDKDKEDSPVSAAPSVLPKTHEFEFRVNGTVTGQVDVSLASTAEGTTLLRTDVPWFVTVKSTRTFMFLSLSASSTGFGKLTVQIFVDGQLFRESSADGIEPVCSISGQWSAGDAIQASHK